MRSGTARRSSSPPWRPIRHWQPGLRWPCESGCWARSHRSRRSVGASSGHREGGYVGIEHEYVKYTLTLTLEVGGIPGPDGEQGAVNLLLRHWGLEDWVRPKVRIVKSSL